jgi:hypothetical protein
MTMLHLCVMTQLEISLVEHVEKLPVPPPVLLALVSDDLTEVVHCGARDSFVSLTVWFV